MTPRQLEELSNFFPDQFIMPSESWHWKLAWQVGGGSKRASNVDPYWILTGSSLDPDWILIGSSLHSALSVRSVELCPHC